jgi:hypothetical protein
VRYAQTCTVLNTWMCSTELLHGALRCLILLTEPPPERCPSATVLKLQLQRRELRDAIVASREPWVNESSSVYEEEVVGWRHPALSDASANAGVETFSSDEEGGSDDDEEVAAARERRRIVRESKQAQDSAYTRQERFHARALRRPELTAMQVMVRLCRAALAATGSSRTSGQTRVLEFVLYLVQNLASVPPSAEVGSSVLASVKTGSGAMSTSGTSMAMPVAVGSTSALTSVSDSSAPGGVSATLREAGRAADVDFLAALEKDLVLRIAVGLSALLDASENASLTRYLLRLFGSLLGQADASLLVRAWRASQNETYLTIAAPTTASTTAVHNATLPARAVVSRVTTANIPVDTDPLAKLRQAGAVGRRGGLASSSSRHSHFGAAFEGVRAAGLTRVGKEEGVSSRTIFSNPFTGAIAKEASGGRTRSTRRGGRTSTMSATASSGGPQAEATREAVAKMTMETGMTNGATQHALLVLFRLAKTLLGVDGESSAVGFSVLMKRVKRELVRGQDELGASGMADFLSLVRFSLSFHQEMHSAALAEFREQDEREHLSPPVFKGHGLGSVLDFYTFTQAVRVAESALTAKDLDGSAIAAAAIKEMLSTLSLLRSSRDSAAKSLGDSVTNLVFYERDIIDIVPKLLRHWEPGRFTRQYLFSLIEAAHVTLKVSKDLASLGARVLAKKRGGHRESSGRKVTAVGDVDEGDVDQEDELVEVSRAERQSRRSETSLSFDTILSEYLYKNTMRAYAAALSTWQLNGARKNHFVASFLTHVAHAKVRFDLTVLGQDVKSSPWPFTRMPMLWHLEFLLPMTELLNSDSAWRRGLTPAAWYKRRKQLPKGVSPAPRPEFASLVDVADEVCERFLQCSVLRPVLMVEALVWRDRQDNDSIACGMDIDGDTILPGRGAGSSSLFEAMAEARRNAEAANDDASDADEWDIQASAAPTTTAPTTSAPSSSSDAAAEPSGGRSNAPVPARGWSVTEDAKLSSLFSDIRDIPSVYECILSIAGGVRGWAQGRSVEDLESRCTELGLELLAAGTVDTSFSTARGKRAQYQYACAKAEAERFLAESDQGDEVRRWLANYLNNSILQWLENVDEARAGWREFCEQTGRDPSLEPPEDRVPRRVSVALFLTSSAEHEWVSMAPVQRLLRRCGMRPPQAQLGEVWWRLEGSVACIEAASQGLLDALVSSKASPLDVNPLGASPKKRAREVSDDEESPARQLISPTTRNDPVVDTPGETLVFSDSPAKRTRVLEPDSPLDPQALV